MKNQVIIALTIIEARAIEVLLASVLNGYSGPPQIRQHYERVLELLREHHV